MPGGIVTVLTGNLIALIAFWVFPLRTRLALDRLEHRPGLCAISGILGWIATIPLAIVLLCTIVLAPLVLVEVVAAIAGAFVGTAAIALLIGRRLYEILAPGSTASEPLILVLGIVLLTAAELLPLVGFFVALVAGFVSLGAAILTFLPDHRLTARSSPASASSSNPPMHP